MTAKFAAKPANDAVDEALRIDVKHLDAILKQVVATIEQSRGELFAIAEEARREYQEVAEQLARVREEAAARIMEVDLFEKQDRQARALLLQVSGNIKAHSEAAVKEAYDQAREARVRLEVAREREAYLRRERDSLERRLKRLQDAVRRAETLINQVGMAFSLLTGQIQEITAHMEDLQKRQQHVVTVIRAQEEERRRVARDIHDGPAQLLANVVFRIEVCQKLIQTDLARATAELDELKSLVRQSLQDVRKIIFDLRPMALDDLGLVPALRGYLEGFSERTGVQGTLKVFGDERRLAPSLEVAVFRLVQEALNNVWKHARARSVTVKVELMPSQVRAVVEDDGVGFDVAAAMEDRHKFGLLGMRERVELLDGSLDIASVPGRGTRITFSIPLRENK